MSKNINVIKIATRDSALAVWQAEMVRKQLNSIGITSQLVLIKSTGDLSLDTPVNALGSTGVFTKAIDDAVLDGRANIGVHSLKDLPTEIDERLIIACVFEREDPHDLIVLREKDFTEIDGYEAIIATGSVRRKAQWLHRFPHDKFVPVRGNVNTRLKKLEESNWDGMFMAAAGLKRLNIQVNHKRLNWMLPAPAQGVIVAVAKKEDAIANNILPRLNHRETTFQVLAERTFLKGLKAGCSTAVAALAILNKNEIILKTEILSPDGKEKITNKLSDTIERAMYVGEKSAEIAMRQGAEKLLKGEG